LEQFFDSQAGEPGLALAELLFWRQEWVRGDSFWKGDK